MFNVIMLCQTQIKLSSVQLARKYMKRVASELDAMSEPEKEPNREFLVLQGVRFAFRVHQVDFTSILRNEKSRKKIYVPSITFQQLINCISNLNHDVFILFSI